ncbi:MAG: hypothetical protein ABI910_16600 [Gemmatimonadota bacterium]
MRRPRSSDKHGARVKAEYTNAIQRWVRDSTRLGIPVHVHDEALNGLQGPALAATVDLELPDGQTARRIRRITRWWTQ